MTFPIDPIGEIQAEIIARLTAAFTGSDGRRALKAIEPIDMPFDKDTEKTFRIAPPAIYVVPLLVSPGKTDATLSVRWTPYILAGGAATDTRTTGRAAPLELGAYAIATRTAQVLRGWSPDADGASALRLAGIENLTGMIWRDRHLQVWSVILDGEISLGLQNPLEAGFNGDDLEKFLRLHADWDIPPHEDPPATLPAERDAGQEVELPQ